MVDKECRRCGFNYKDYGCICPHADKWYACPIENTKPENVQALKEYAEWLQQYEGEWVAESDDNEMNASKSIGQDYVIDQVLGRGIEGVDNTDYYTEYEIYTNPTIVINRIHKDEIEKLMEILYKKDAFNIHARKTKD